MDKVFTRRTPGVTESEVAAIRSVLEEISVGDIATYEQMNEVVGRNVRKQCETALYRALKECLQDGKVFDVIPTIGYKRLDDISIVDNSAGLFRHIKRTGAKIAARLNAVNVGTLDEGRKRDYLSQTSLTGAIVLFSSSSALKKVRQENLQTALPVGKVMELFK